VLQTAIDPGDATDYQFTAAQGSPQFDSIALPLLPGIAGYEVSLETGSAWSAAQSLAPGATLTAATPFDGVRFNGVDGTGQAVLLNDSLIFDVGFTNTGNFTGDLNESGLACFAAGTRLATPGGAVAVERLTAVDLVCTAGGGRRPVRWVGHRDIVCADHPRPGTVHPIRIAAHAFAPGRPQRDLLLSPDHAVFIDGVLIPVRYLVNDATIAAMPRARISYWHVELDRHDVLLAEGLACESYLDTGNRSAFANGGPAVQLHPDFGMRIWDLAGCAPLVRDGAALEAARSWLLARAAALGHAITADPALRAIWPGGEAMPTRNGRRHRFHLAKRGILHLASRSAIPAHTRDSSPDHRRLGVAIGRLALNGRRIGLADPRLGEGWHDLETGAGGETWRWTDGHAALHLAAGGVLDVDVVMTERYWRPQARPPEHARGMLRA
jgi:hypothetical protein